MARAINFQSQEKCLGLTYFARRPDVNRVLKCAKRKDLYSAKVDINRQKRTIRVRRIASRNLGAKPPGKFWRTCPLLSPRMHLTTKLLPVLNLDFDNSVAIFCRVAAPRNSLSLSKHNLLWLRRLLGSLKGSLSPLKNENTLDKDLYCTLLKFVLMCFIQRNQGHRDSVKHEFSSNVNKVNKTVAKVRTIGDKLPLTAIDRLEYLTSIGSNFFKKFYVKNLYFVLERSSPSNYCLPQT